MPPTAHVVAPDGTPGHEFDMSTDALAAIGYRVTSLPTCRTWLANAEATAAADVIVLLPGWESSPGAVADVMVAVANGIPCVDLAALLGQPVG